MEELVGEFWHRIITRTVQNDNESAKAELSSLSRELSLFFRAIGGDASLVIEGTDTRRFKVQRKLLQKIAGSHQKFSVCWQDDRSLRLPVTISLFSEPKLNEALYFWQTAMAAKLPLLKNWFGDNQNACLQLINNYPGLAKSYYQLAEKIVEMRPSLNELDGEYRTREHAIQQAILKPGKVRQLPKSSGDPLPVPLWIYPAPLHALSITADEDIEEVCAHDESLSTDIVRKEAKRTDDTKETDGLLVFQLEALFTWTEQIELDRVQDENQEDDILSSAEDLDIITLSRKRRSGSSSIKFDLDLPAAENDDLPLGDGILLPEWNYKKSSYIDDFCLLQPFLADDALPSPVPEHLLSSVKSLKNQFSLLQPDRRWQRHQISGEEVDLDAWLTHLTEPIRNIDKQDYYLDRCPASRSLACLLLADLSMSTECGMSNKQRVIDVISDSLVLLAEALSASSDKFAMYGFSSVKNKQIRYHLLKNFNEKYSDATRGRIISIKPGFYTRMGAAIRQSTEILKEQKANQRLLLIISDGKPNDLDQYEGRYGIEDTRKAVIEAKRQGLTPFCVTIDHDGNDYLPYLFGDQGYIIVNDAIRLPKLLPKLYLHLTGISA